MSMEMTVTKKKVKIKKAPKYSVVFFNNDVTTFDTVMYLLCKVFNYTTKDAHDKTIEIHENDRCSVYVNSKEVCEMKNKQVEEERAQLMDKHLKHIVEKI
jgi:ATP-dependent Clp protease adapter protein ClpS